MDYVVDDGAVRVGRTQQNPLCRPPWVVWAIWYGSSRPWRRRDEGEGVEDLSESAQRPLFVQPGGQYPFALRRCLDVQTAALCRRLVRLPLAVRLLQQLDLLVGVDVDALRREARHQWARQGLVRERGMRVHVQIGPLVLVLEVVLDLYGERLQLRKVQGRGRTGIDCWQRIAAAARARLPALCERGTS